VATHVRQILVAVAWAAAVGGLDEAATLDWSWLPGPLPAIVALVLAWAIQEAKRREDQGGGG